MDGALYNSGRLVDGSAPLANRGALGENRQRTEDLRRGLSGDQSRTPNLPARVASVVARMPLKMESIRSEVYSHLGSRVDV